MWSMIYMNRTFSLLSTHIVIWHRRCLIRNYSANEWEIDKFLTFISIYYFMLIDLYEDKVFCESLILNKEKISISSTDQYSKTKTVSDTKAPFLKDNFWVEYLFRRSQPPSPQVDNHSLLLFL